MLVQLSAKVVGYENPETEELSLIFVADIDRDIWKFLETTEVL